MPAGRALRAPLAPQLERAQALLVIGEGAPGERVAREGYAAGIVVLRGRLAPDAQAVARLFGKRVLAYAGIGRPAKFFDTLRSLGMLPVATRAFPDHHVYTQAEIAELRAQAEEDDLLLVTTEKDAMRLAGSEIGQELLGVSDVLPVRMALEPQSARALDRMLAGLGGTHSRHPGRASARAGIVCRFLRTIPARPAAVRDDGQGAQRPRARSGCRRASTASGLA